MKSLLHAVILFSVSSSAVASLPSSASHIVSTVRCTLVDTRNPTGPYGGPRMQAGVTRSVNVPAGPCPGIPAALGYNLIFTAIGPDANTVQLRAWPTGTAVPDSATTDLISSLGHIKGMAFG